MTARREQPARVRRILQAPRRLAPAQWVLALLIVGGIVLRVLTCIAYWPVMLTLYDSGAYAELAETRLIGDPQHPGGYAIALHVLGWITRDVAVTIVIQHLLGIVAALLLYSAVLRVTGSRWPALLPAAAVLLNADQVYLEHSVMSEALFVAMFAAALYATVRAIDAPGPWWRWPLAAGVITGLAVTVRTSGLFFVPVLVLALLLSRPRPWRLTWRLPVGAGAGAAAILLVYAISNGIVGGRVEVGPATGWHLYGRVAPFADCRQFTPPKGTEALCTLAPAEDIGGNFYMYDPASPAMRTFGELGASDDELTSWSLEVIRHQPRTYLATVVKDMTAFFVPSDRVGLPFGGVDLEELDFARIVDDPTQHRIETWMETFFDDFSVDEDMELARTLEDYQGELRYGATPLAISALLVLLGLLVGPRRLRVGVLLFGGGGLAVLLLPMFGVWYTGRYAIPVIGAVTAGAAIALYSLWQLERDRRAHAKERAAADGPQAAAG